MTVCSVQISFYIPPFFLFYFFYTISEFPLATKATENDHTKNFRQNIADKTEYTADHNVAFHYQYKLFVNLVSTGFKVADVVKDKRGCKRTFPELLPRSSGNQRKRTIKMHELD